MGGTLETRSWVSGRNTAIRLVRPRNSVAHLRPDFPRRAGRFSVCDLYRAHRPDLSCFAVPYRCFLKTGTNFLRSPTVAGKVSGRTRA